MALLERFSPPAGLPEPTQADAEAWSVAVDSIVAPFAARFAQFYDPLQSDTPAQTQKASIAWTAFPASLRREVTSEEQRWKLADSNRDKQDEYCEWGVERDGNGRITRVTFTTEVREYWEHVARDPDRLLALYHEFVSPKVELSDLVDAGGSYVIDNRWNRETVGRPAHLVQGNNNLGAAVDLAASATVLRERNGQPVTDQQDLVECAGLGNPFRNSDPQIASVVNNLAASGAEITLADPPGLYIDALLTAGMTTPDGADPATFWTIERGDAEHILRANYAVPADRGYTVSDIQIAGRSIQFGAQLADRVQVKISALAKPGSHKPVPQPCK